MEVTITTLRQSVKRGKMSRDLCFFRRPPIPASIRHQSRIIHLPHRMIHKQSPLFISPLSHNNIKGGKEVGRLAASRSIKKPFASPQKQLCLCLETQLFHQRFLPFEG
ncbi:hypothetical protein CEXT_483961 [Caerostris extrusa]|uniref:Uncharacterized protein n=1 Tax=Caerostris extrusa TaxID=172846 RepID=A0AAV4PIG6_CAEEX|nr:hypothetical protein CEXT_483961 [Caerostris extrusa]